MEAEMRLNTAGPLSAQFRLRMFNVDTFPDAWFCDVTMTLTAPEQALHFLWVDWEYHVFCR